MTTNVERKIVHIKNKQTMYIINAHVSTYMHT